MLKLNQPKRKSLLLLQLKKPRKRLHLKNRLKRMSSNTLKSFKKLKKFWKKLNRLSKNRLKWKTKKSLMKRSPKDGINMPKTMARACSREQEVTVVDIEVIVVDLVPWVSHQEMLKAT